MRRILLFVVCAIGAAAHAEKADKDKPTQIEANRMSADDTRKVNIFEGNVVLTKGTLAVRADRIVVRQDAEGFQHTTAVGSPVRFKQRMDPKDGEKEARWLDGEARRIEINDREQKVELFDSARARYTAGLHSAGRAVRRGRPDRRARHTAHYKVSEGARHRRAHNRS